MLNASNSLFCTAFNSEIKPATQEASDLTRLKEFNFSAYSNLTGVTFVHAKHGLFFEEDRRMRKYTIKGKSFQLWFLLNFVVDEETLAIKTLQIYLKRGIQSLISPFIKEVCATQSLYLFFHAFSQFAEMALARKKIFNRMRTEYPENVIIPQGEYGPFLYFDNLNGFRFILFWDITISVKGEIEQELQLSPKVTQRYIKADTKQSLRLLSTKFHALVRTKGLYQSLILIIRLISVTEEDSVD